MPGGSYVYSPYGSLMSGRVAPVPDLNMFGRCVCVMVCVYGGVWWWWGVY